MTIDTTIESGSGHLESFSDDRLMITLEKEKHLYRHSFYFKIKEKHHPYLKILVKNANQSDYAEGWKHYKPFISEDGQCWVRSKAASYDENGFSFSITESTQYVAWYPPYTTKCLQAYLSDSFFKEKMFCFKQSELPYLLIGDSNKPCWVILARQHPGESASSYFMEGLLNHIKKHQISILDRFSFFIVPILNVAGVKQGNHRLTPGGIDLNRSWTNKSCVELEEIKEKIAALQNVFMVLDVHGDEVSKKSYITYPKLSASQLDNLKNFFDETYFLFLPEHAFWRRFAKQLIRKRKLRFPKKRKTALNYFNKKGYLALTLELSAHNLSPEDCRSAGASVLDHIE